MSSYQKEQCVAPKLSNCGVKMSNRDRLVMTRVLQRKRKTTAAQIAVELNNCRRASVITICREFHSVGIYCRTSHHWHQCQENVRHSAKNITTRPLWLESRMNFLLICFRPSVQYIWGKGWKNFTILTAWFPLWSMEMGPWWCGVVWHSLGPYSKRSFHISNTPAHSLV